MICPRCWQTIPDDATTCPSCGRRRATGAPAVAQQPGATPTPRVIPVLTTTGAPQTAFASSATPLPPDETPTLLTRAATSDEADEADEADDVAADGATRWASVPPLLTSDSDELENLDNLDDVPFAMTAAPMPLAADLTTPQPAESAEPDAAEQDTPATPTEPDVPDEPTTEPGHAPEEESSPAGDGLPDYETPDIERPAIHLPMSPLPDYETPDEERPAIHLVKPLPDFDTPDVERPAVHSVPEDTPAPGAARPTPLLLIAAPESAYSAHDAQDTQNTQNNVYDADAPTLIGADTYANDSGDADVSDPSYGSDAAPDYPEAYTSPHAARVGYATSSPSAMSAPSGAAARPLQPPRQAASSDPIERFFGVQPPPRGRVANNAIQRLWLRSLPPESATAPWISIPNGALVALAAGLLLSIVGLLLWSAAITYLLGASNVLGASGNLAHAVLAPNLLQLLLLEHGVPMSLALSTSGATGSFSALVTAPLTGLSLIPAAALILGGYIAAASDFTHRLRFSVLRGALIGPVYAILLLLIAVFGSSDARLGDGAAIQLHPSLGVAFLAGLIWGTLLGALGGLLAVRRHHLFTTNRRPDMLAGASWGALIALGSGLLLALVALAVGVVAHAIGTVPAAPTGQAGGGIGVALDALLTAVALLIVVAPVAALWLFVLGAGANIETWLSASGVSGHPGTTSFGLLAAHDHPPSVVWWLLLLIPLASYVIGGRAAAHIARADSLRDGALAGWLMAVALSLLMLALTLLTRIVLASDATVGGRSMSITLGIAPASLAVFLLVLIVGGVLGALGGASAVLAPQAGPTLSWQIAPLLPHLEPALSRARQPWDLFDAARGHPTPRTPMRALFYAAILSAVALVALLIVVALLGWIASHFAPIGAIRGFDGFFAGLAVGAPLLLLACAAILAALRSLPPLLRKPPTQAPVLPRYPTAR